MTVSIHGHVLQDLENLSAKARTVLGFIADGKDWLERAIASASESYAFAGESALGEGIQSGLHGDGLLLLPNLGLRVSAERLWQLSQETLEILQAAADSDSPPSLKTRRTLAASNLWTADDLANGRQFLKKVGVDDEPVFQAMSLRDLVEVFELGDSAPESSEAAKFAVKVAINPQEFVDFYQLYSVVADAFEGKPAATAGRVQEVLDLLLPYVWGLLRCPHVAEDLSPTEVGVLARAWLASGAPLGFATVSRALAEIVLLAGGRVSDAESAEKAVKTYTDASRSLLSSRDPSTAELSQDGSVQLFRVAGKGASALLAHDRARGSLTMRWLNTPAGRAGESGPRVATSDAARKPAKKTAKKPAKKTAKKAAKRRAMT